ncbi:hypothetical protein BO71DRAFT_426032 [Aspergillus ellipticus CBS 707.79]|uniref:BRCT domain-containing protein n=1 Tax=Aspergillus ellipticus CBS 707.79 TaxID=1448320 RepID=A0A319DM04_9EURO|nr:hypothetical protein BO71DRAFT_426032 [Aspergillus ellipticus CBS 707.79]
MGKTFKNIYACSVGKFDGNADKIPQWVRANGGRYSKDISEEITHLIASKEAYKGDVETVRKAKRLKSIKIVSYDWLEDSLLSKNRRPKREAEYLLENLLNNEKKRKRETSNKEDEKPKTQPPKKRTARYHIYIDKGDRVTYNATLVRLTISMNAREKYVVKVYESNKEPYVYATHVEYSRIGRSGYRSEGVQDIFKDKTGKEWDDRRDRILPSCKRDAEGKLLPPHEGWFYYENREGSISSFLREEVVVDMTVNVGQGLAQNRPSDPQEAKVKLEKDGKDENSVEHAGFRRDSCDLTTLDRDTTPID